MKAYGRDHRLPKPAMSDADPVREHVRALMGQGFALERIAEAAGVGRGRVADLMYGRRGARKHLGHLTEIPSDVAARLLDTSSSEVIAGRVSSLGSARRLQALIAIGYSQTMLAELLDKNVGNFHSLVTGARAMVVASTHDAVVDLYERLSGSPLHGGSAERARRVAERNGWVSPLAWDDIDTDVAPDQGDTSFAVDDVAIELACAGEQVRLYPQERRIAVARLHGQQFSDRRIANTLHVAERTVVRIRGELDLPAWSLEEQRVAATIMPRQSRRAAA